MDAFAFVLMTFTFYVFELLNGVSGRRPDRRVQGEGHSLSGDTMGRRPLPYPLGRAHNYRSGACSYSGL